MISGLIDALVSEIKKEDNQVHIKNMIEPYKTEIQVYIFFTLLIILVTFFAVLYGHHRIYAKLSELTSSRILPELTSSRILPELASSRILPDLSPIGQKII